MLLLTFHHSDDLLMKLAKFNQLLQIYKLKIIKQEIDSPSNTLLLNINARSYGEIKAVTTFAYNFFKPYLRAIKNDS
jgi:hypothetical protein